MTNCLIKNVIPEIVLETFGNSGSRFPYKENNIPEEPLCPLAFQENREIYILSESGETLLISC